MPSCCWTTCGRGKPPSGSQVTTDGYKIYVSIYVSSTWDAFGPDLDYAMLVKQYENMPYGPETRYSPAAMSGIKVKKVSGTPDPAHISTSYVECQNLTLRMGVRRFARLTYGFSKKAENLAAAISLHFNFASPHQTPPSALRASRPRRP